VSSKKIHFTLKIKTTFSVLQLCKSIVTLWVLSLYCLSHKWLWNAANQDKCDNCWDSSLIMCLSWYPINTFRNIKNITDTNKSTKKTLNRIFSKLQLITKYSIHITSLVSTATIKIKSLVLLTVSGWHIHNSPYWAGYIWLTSVRLNNVKFFPLLPTRGL
jgi:hypothetical protein